MKPETVDDMTCYRVTFRNGSTCHTAYRPLAEVWAQDAGSRLEVLDLKRPADLCLVRSAAALVPQQFMVSSIKHKAGIVTLVTINAEDVQPSLESGQILTLTPGVEGTPK